MQRVGPRSDSQMGSLGWPNDGGVGVITAHRLAVRSARGPLSSHQLRRTDQVITARQRAPAASGSADHAALRVVHGSRMPGGHFQPPRLGIAWPDYSGTLIGPGHDHRQKEPRPQAP